ncbi:UNVERIFIED_CONTAM: E3 ubiquitin-protein ligase WAV3 [Sesamum latifolium]|uniref:E3 ubiquitin-protein ligase WAV3 n=1 Tax=Sesamum latifolium TaxID=2727402 RepID=A0AAW2T9Q8_9LAMI
MFLWSHFSFQKYLYSIVILLCLQKTCAICLGSVETGQGQAIFTAECSHSFHFACIGNSVTHGNYLCPICRARWNDLPLVMPHFNPNANNSSIDHELFHDSWNLHFPALQRQPPVRRGPVIEPEPLLFSDDEPLPAVTANVSPSALQNVSIKAVPERPAVAASESIPRFAVLVGLRAPSLSEDARQMQRAPIDLVTVLDVSGSMHGSKLTLLKRAVNFVVDNLGPLDRLSVVSFSTHARRIFPLRRMTEHGRDDAKRAVNSLLASGSTNIVEGLKKGVQVIEERHHHNPVASIIFLSDGRDTCNHGYQLPTFANERRPPQYLHLLPACICPGNRETQDQDQREIFPVHAFGFGSDHDPLTMHAISDLSAGTFSFIESYEMVQDAFASCIGGLLSVVTQELRLMVRSASHGVEIKSIPSGRYASEISDQGSQGTINIGDLYADEEKEFLINISVPILMNAEGEESERKTSLLDITCSYRDVVSKEMVQIEGDLVEIRRPESPSPPDLVVNLEVDRQRNRLNAAESIAEAQRMADTGNLSGAQSLLSNRRSALLASPSGQAGDGLCMWLEAEMKETEQRMGSRHRYEREGRAYALSSMSAHGYQRATTRGSRAAAAFGGSASFCSGDLSAAASASINAYMTPLMADMVSRSQLLNITEDATASRPQQLNITEDATASRPQQLNTTEDATPNNDQQLNKTEDATPRQE